MRNGILLSVIVLTACAGTPPPAPTPDPVVPERDPAIQQSFDDTVEQFTTARFTKTGGDYRRFAPGVDRDRTLPGARPHRVADTERFNAASGYAIIDSRLLSDEEGYFVVEWSSPIVKVSPDLTDPHIDKSQRTDRIEAPRLVLTLRYHAFWNGERWEIPLGYTDFHEMESWDAYNGPEKPLIWEHIRQVYHEERRNDVTAMRQALYHAVRRQFDGDIKLPPEDIRNAPDFAVAHFEMLKAARSKWEETVTSTGIQTELVPVKGTEGKAATVRLTNKSTKTLSRIRSSVRWAGVRQQNEVEEVAVLEPGELAERRVEVPWPYLDYENAQVYVTGLVMDGEIVEPIFPDSEEVERKLALWQLSEHGGQDPVVIVKQILHESKRIECPGWDRPADVDVTFGPSGVVRRLELEDNNPPEVTECVRAGLKAVKIVDPGIERRIRFPLYPDHKLR